MNADIEEKLIPPNYSLNPLNLVKHKKYGIKIFQERVNKNREREILQQSHWGTIIDHILQNMILSGNITTNAIELLRSLKARASDCVIPLEEKRILSLSHKTFVNPGCIELFLELGFMQMDNLLIITEPNKGIIDTATATIAKRIEIIKLTHKLDILWSECMTMMEMHKDYNTAAILYQISRYNFTTNYHQYFEILNKLIYVSPQNIAEADEDFVIEILSSIGFKTLLVYAQTASNKTIFKHMKDIYDVFRRIECIKRSIYNNEVYVQIDDEEDMKLEAEQAINNDAHAAIPPQDAAIVIVPFVGIGSFKAILNHKSKQIMYEQLLHPLNWSHLIDSMCKNMKDQNKMTKKLENFKKTAEKSSKDKKFRKIDMKNSVTKKKLLNIHGGKIWLEAIGFEQEHNSSILHLRKPNPHIINTAIKSISDKIQILQQFAAVQEIWSNMIANMYNDASLLSQANALNALLAIDISNDEADGYQTMVAYVTDIRRITHNDDDHRDIPQLMLQRLGIMNVANMNVLKCISSIYAKIRKLDEFKQNMSAVIEIGTASRKLLSMHLTLNDLWQNCIDLMKQHPVYQQQKYIIHDMKQRDFAQNTDYKWLLSKISEAGQTQVYSDDLLAAKQILRHLNFQIPHNDYNEREILKCMVKIYQKVEDIDNYTAKYGKRKKIIRTAATNKRDSMFRNNEDNVIGDFRATTEKKQTPHGDKAAFFQQNVNMENDEDIYQESLMQNKQRARAMTISIRCDEVILKCKYTQRILKSLDFFSTLNLRYVQDQNMLVQYFQQEHKSLLDDHIHMLKYHSTELHKAAQNDELKCSYDLGCESLARFHGDQDNENIETRRGRTRAPSNVEYDNAEFIFYRDTMDSIHSYLYHLFDLGIINIDDEQAADLKHMDSDSDSEEKYDHVPDLPPLQSSASGSRHRMSKSKRLSLRVQRMSINAHAHKRPQFAAKQASVYQEKFKLVPAMKNEDKSCMFIDGMCEYIGMQRVQKAEIDKMLTVLYAEDYDSDALLDDIDDGQDATQSNIAQLVAVHEHYNVIMQYVNFTKLSERSFSIGFRFYYWEYYRQRIDMEESEYFQNKNFHSGYKPHELYVAPAFGNIKKEVLHNNILTIDLEDFNRALHKTKMYFRTDEVREIKSEGNIFLHYEDIWEDQPLLEEHLLAVTLYCDWSKLSAEFSATFRKKHVYEPIASVKRRNRQFAHWSKRLRETVELYGKRGWEKREKDEEIWNKTHNRIKGPFFCGIDSLMPMPEFSIRLCAPTSTSSSDGIATNFAGDDGIIITLNNNGHWHSDNLRIWDCSWLSNYKQEDEKLIMGGFYTIRIEDICYIKTGEQFKAYFKSLFYLDCMLTGISMLRQKPHIRKKDKQNLSRLMIGDKQNLSSYVKDTFCAYKNHRRQLVINLHQIHTYFDKLKHLVIESTGKTWECEVCFSQGNSVHSSRCWMCTATSSNNVRLNNNLVKSSTLEQFPNLEHIVLYTTSGTGQNEYVFDATKLLNNVVDYVSSAKRSHQVIEIEIKATHRYEVVRNRNRNEMIMTHKRLSWLSDEWSNYGPTLELFLKSLNPKSTITLQHTENRGARRYQEDTMFIKMYP